MIYQLLSLAFLLSPILLIVLVTFLVFFLEKKRKWPLWFKIGLIFFIISLVSAILTSICSESVKGQHPDAGIICRIPALPLLLSLVIFSSYTRGYLILILSVILNTIIGIIFGFLIDDMIKKYNQKNG